MRKTVSKNGGMDPEDHKADLLLSHTFKYPCSYPLKMPPLQMSYSYNLNNGYHWAELHIVYIERCK